MYEHQLATKIRYQSYQRLAEARQFQKSVIEYQIIDGEPNITAKDKMNLSVLYNEIVEAEYKIQQILPILLESVSKVYHANEWRSCHERKSRLEKQHG